MKRKAIALILSVCFAASLTACGTQQKDTPSEAVQTVSTASVTTDDKAILASDFEHPAFAYKGAVYFLGKFPFSKLLKNGITLNDKTVTDPEYLTSPYESHDIVCASGDNEVHFTVVNTTDQVQALSDNTVTKIAFISNEFQGIKGLPIGVKFEDLQKNLGTPYRTRQAASDDTATYICDYTGLWNDVILSVYVNRTTHQVMEVDEKQPTAYITDAADVTNDQIYDYINQYKADHTDSTPFASLKDDDSENGYGASGDYSNITFTKAKLLTLKKIKDIDSFNNSSAVSGGLMFPDDYVPLSVLLIEYKADSSVFSGATGALVIYNPSIDPSGKIVSTPVITDQAQNTTSDYQSYYDIGVYKDDKNLLKDALYGVKQDYSLSDYDESEKEIGTPEGNTSSRQEASKNIVWSVASSSTSSSSEQKPTEETKGSGTTGKPADMSKAKTSLALRKDGSDPIMTNAFFADDYTLDALADGKYSLMIDDTDATEKVQQGDVLLLTGANDGTTKSGGIAIKVTALGGSDGNGFVTFTGEHFLDGKYDKLADDSTAILQSVPAN